MSESTVLERLSTLKRKLTERDRYVTREELNEHIETVADARAEIKRLEGMYDGLADEYNELEMRFCPPTLLRVRGR